MDANKEAMVRRIILTESSLKFVFQTKLTLNLHTRTATVCCMNLIVP